MDQFWQKKKRELAVPITPSEALRLSRQLLATIIMLVVALIISALVGSPDALLYPQYHPSHLLQNACIVLAILAIIAFALRARPLGRKAIGIFIIFAVLAFPTCVFIPMTINERLSIWNAFSEGKSHIFHDNFRIYGTEIHHGRGGPSYSIRIAPYGFWVDFNVSEADYLRVQGKTTEAAGYPYCLSVKVQQVGIAVRALSPPRRLDPKRTITQCVAGSVRSENKRFTFIPSGS